MDATDSVRGCETVLRADRAAASPLPPSPVALENQKPGTPGWAMIGVAPGRAIEGYTVPSAPLARRSASYVSAEPQASYRILVYESGGTAAWGRGWSPACPAARRARGPRRAGAARVERRACPCRLAHQPEPRHPG